MSTVTVDLVENAQWEEEDGKVVRARRIAFVDGLSAVVAEQNRIAEALAATGVPAAGEVHPNLSSLVVGRRIATMLGPSQARIDVLYRPLDFLGPDPPTGDNYRVGGGASLVSVETQRDKNGDPIVLKYPQRQDQGGSVQVDIVHSRLSYERSIQTAVPGLLVEFFVNRLNDSTWQGKPAGIWKCVAGTFDLRNPETDDGVGGTVPLYDVRFEFESNPLGWDPEIVYILPETGKPPADWQEHPDAFAVVPIHDFADFDALPL